MTKTNLKALIAGTALAASPFLANAWGFNMNSDSDDYNGNNGSSWSWGTSSRNYQRPIPPQQPRMPRQTNQQAQKNAAKATQNDGTSRSSTRFDMNAPSFSFGDGWNPNYNYQQRPNWGYPPQYGYPQNYSPRYAPQPYPYQLRYPQARPQQATPTTK